MIDWLEEVLKAAEDQEAEERLQALLFTVGAIPHPSPAAADGGEALAAEAVPGLHWEERELTEPFRLRERAALAGLYRRAGEAVRTAPVSPVSRTEVVVRENTATAAGLTAEGLDRAVRRDSRRYDGAMSLY